jgi:DNA-binding IclR family transcriptional regulator
MTKSYVHFVKSAQRVLEVLEYFDNEKTSASVTDISRALSYPQSSTSVLLRCLRELGFLYYNRAHRTYRPTARAALLGCWADNGNYRGGKVLSLVDALEERFGETVVVSCGQVDYAVHHLYVARGSAPGSIAIQKGKSGPTLHSIQGELILASYPDQQIRLALHRLNAEEEDPKYRFNITTKLSEMQALRQRGWAISQCPEADGTGSVAIMIPRHNGGGRMIVSIFANFEMIEERGKEIMEEMRQARDDIFGMTPDNVVDNAETIKQIYARGKSNIYGGDRMSLDIPRSQ